MTDGSNNLRNATYIYIQTFLSLIASLFVSRTVLNLLGVRDFGIYSVVGGVVTLFVFINTAMAISTQRHLTFEMGRGDEPEAKRVYSASIVIHFAIAVIILLFAELIAIKLFSTYINIPADRKAAAIWVFQLAVCSVMFSIINVPQQALLNSKENFLSSSIISLLFSMMYLVSAYSLNFLQSRRLEFYAFFIFCSNVFIYVIYQFVCRRYYNYRFAFVRDLALYKELTSFAGWNMMGAAAMVLRNHGIGVVLNIFYGVTINASYGIANQVGSAAENFAQSVVRAFNPSIVKNYAAKEMSEMFNLAYMSSRISFYILYLMTLPLLFEINYALHLWLKNVPEYAPMFCILMLLNVMVEVLSFPLMTIAQATGQIRMYQATNSALLAMNIPIMIIVLRAMNNPNVGLMCVIFISIILLFSRLFFLRRIASMEPGSWFRAVIFRVSIPVISSSMVLYALVHLLPQGFARFSISLVLGTCTTIITAWLFGLGDEREMIFQKLRSALHLK